MILCLCCCKICRDRLVQVVAIGVAMSSHRLSVGIGAIVVVVAAYPDFLYRS
jgi:hypothetical protein